MRGRSDGLTGQERTVRFGRHGELKRVTSADRKKIALATSVNRRWRAWEEARRDAMLGPGACSACGGQPCGASWPRARCCHDCSHVAMPGWRPTHVLWYQRRPFYVMEVRMRLNALYYREDGVCQWVRRTVQEGDVEHFFLGQRVGRADFARFLFSDPEGYPEGPDRENPTTRYELVSDEASDEEDAGEDDDGEDDGGEDVAENSETGVEQDEDEDEAEAAGRDTDEEDEDEDGQ